VISDHLRDRHPTVPQSPPFHSIKKSDQGIPMLRTSVCLAAMLLVTASLDMASAQTAAPATAAKPSKMKLTIEHLKEMRAKWVQNRPKLKACRAEVRSKGLIGDDRWFYIADCMEKS
jgi:hypothetical protein